MLGPRGSLVRRSTATFVFVSLAAFSSPAFAACDEPDERRMQAQALFDQGVKLEGSDPKAALGALRSSYEIQANFRVLYNIARVCLKIGDKECAARSFEQYLKEGGSDISPKRRKEVEGELKSLAPGKGGTSLTIKSSISGAFVKIDGSVVGRTPLAQPIRVTAGNHKVVLVADGNVIEKSVHIAAGSSETVELETKREEPPAPAPTPAITRPVEPMPAPPPAAPPPPPEPAPVAVKAEPAPVKPAETKGGFPVVPWIVAGTFATGTAVTGILTAAASSEYAARQEQFPVSRERLDDAHGKGRTLLLVTTALGAITVVSIGVAGYFTFFRGDSKPREKTVGIAVGPNGISISGRLP